MLQTAQMLQTVLDNMSQGVLMFDSEMRLIFLQSTLHRNVRIVAGVLRDRVAVLRDLLIHQIQDWDLFG